MIFPKPVNSETDDSIIEIFPAKLVIAIRGNNADFLTFDFHNRYVKGSSTEIVDHNCLRLNTPVDPKGDCCRSGFIDQVEHLEAGDLTRRDCCPPAVIIEISGDGDHC